MKVCYATLTYEPDIGKSRFLVELVRPYFDEVILVYTGKSMPSDFRQFLNEKGVVLIEYAWVDNFAKARNQYVYKARELGCDYLMVSDADEYPSPQLLQEFKTLATYWNNNGVGLLRVQAMDLFLGYTDEIVRRYINGQPLIEYDDVKETYNYAVTVAANPKADASKPKVPVAYMSFSSFFKPLIFKPQLGEYTMGEPHELLSIHAKEASISFPYYYIHVKSILEIWEHALRNVFIGGGGLNVKEKNPVWARLRSEAAMYGINTWQDLRNYIVSTAKSGKVPMWLINHLIDMSTDCNAPWSAEVADSIRFFNAIFGLYLNVPCRGGTDMNQQPIVLSEHKLHFVNWGLWIDYDAVQYVLEKFGLLGKEFPYAFSPTSAFAVVARLYDAILQRTVDRSGLETYSKLLLRTGDVRRIVEILFKSEEYERRIGDKMWRDRVLGWDGRIDFGKTALPADIMSFLLKAKSGTLLSIGCLDDNQLNELKKAHFVMVYDMTDRDCGLPISPWLYPLPDQQFDYVVVTPIAHLHPLTRYVFTTALALTKPGGYVILPKPITILFEVIKVMETNEYMVFQRVSI